MKTYAQVANVVEYFLSLQYYKWSPETISQTGRNRKAIRVGQTFNLSIMSKKVMVIVDVPGMTIKQYNDSWDHMQEAGVHHPDGLIHHFGGETPEGITVVDVWDSVQHFEEWGKTLGPILAKFGVHAMQSKVMPMHNMHKGLKASV
jgi:hypothetical protein